MSSANIGWMFYKKNFYHLEHEYNPEFDIKAINTDILSAHPIPTETIPQATHSFETKTIYPGLIIGAGYSHGIKGESENFDLGFYFDHTTGMPMIPSSSIKGTLRSIFKRLKQSEQREPIIRFFQDIFGLCGIKLLSGLTDNEAYDVLAKVENSIFEGRDENDQQIGLYQRDKFFDAYISEGDKSDLIFADDILAPHHQDIFKDPNVIRFLKIRSDVTFVFSFELYDMYLGNTMALKAQEKEKLFSMLIQFTGIGAKTNVGYGQFESKISKEGISDIEDPNEIKVMTEKELEDFLKVLHTKDINEIPDIIRTKITLLTEDQTMKIFDSYTQEIQDNENPDADWYNGDIKVWMTSTEISQGKRKKTIGYKYLNILKVLFKD